MKTKNNSAFYPGAVLISRADYDAALAKQPSFLKHLFNTYRRSWFLAGVKFYDVGPEDFAKLFKLLV